MNNTEMLFGQINPRTQLLSVAGSLTLTIIVILLIRKGYLKPGYSILWLGITLLILILSIFIGVLYWFSTTVGIYYPTSAIFSVLIIGIILILVHFSIVISRYDKQIKKLAQESSLIKHDLKKIQTKKSKMVQ